MSLLRNRVRDERLDFLERKLQFDEFIIHFLSRFIERTQNIKIRDLITFDKNRIDIYDMPYIDITVHKKRKSERKKRSAQPISKAIDKSLNDAIEKIYNDIEILFNNIRTYKDVKNFANIKEQREMLLGNVNMSEYIRTILNHYEKIQKISKIKKLKINVHDYFTPLEHRIGAIDGYTAISLDNDENIKFVNTIFTQQIGDLLPFSHELLYNRCANYALALIPIENIIYRIFGGNKIYNLVYFLNTKSTENDPYSFYYLGSLKENGEKCWKLDLRLWNISMNLGNSLTMYCITLFRRIYGDVFGDNNFRSDYNSFSDITAECEQLFSNIIYISHRLNFCKLLQKMVMSNSTRNRGDDDKLTLTADDNHNKKMFADYGETEANANIIENLSRLFDDPDKERLNRMIKCKKIK